MKLTVTHKAAPDDAEFAIAGLGLFVNGEGREVTEEQQDAFYAINGYPVDEIASEYIKIGGKVTLKPTDNEGIPLEEQEAIVDEHEDAQVVVVEDDKDKGGDN